MLANEGQTRSNPQPVGWQMKLRLDVVWRGCPLVLAQGFILIEQRGPVWALPWGHDASGEGGGLRIPQSHVKISPRMQVWGLRWSEVALCISPGFGGQANACKLSFPLWKQ